MVRHLPFGPFVNASERLALERLRSKLTGADGLWLLLTNLDHAARPGARADEIGLVAIGPPGVLVMEVKHWDAEAPLPAAAWWDEDTVVSFAEARYKVLGRLGAGGVGQTFKVVELGAEHEECFGTCDVKVVDNATDGQAASRPLPGPVHAAGAGA